MTCEPCETQKYTGRTVFHTLQLTEVEQEVGLWQDMAPTKDKERTNSTSMAAKKPANEHKDKPGEEEMYECGKCKTQVENVICCERCVRWTCATCADIKSDAKFLLMKEDDITWFCTPCRGLAVQAAQTDKLIEDRCKFYMEQARHEIQAVRMELKGDIGAVNAKVIKVATDVQDFKTDHDTITGELKADVLNLKDQLSKTGYEDVQVMKERFTKMEEEVAEMTQREIRKLNLVVFNLPESE